MTGKPVVYSFRRCPFAMRARLALAVSGVAYELREVDLARKPPEMLAASPKGTVPVLILSDGRVVDESLDIMCWALELNDPEDWLVRCDRALIDRCDGPFKRALDRYKYPDRHGSNPEEHRMIGLAFLTDLETKLAEAAFLAGSRRGMSDAAIIPFVRQFAGVDPDWFAAQKLLRLQAWLADYTGSSLFAHIMERAATSTEMRATPAPH